MDKDKNKNKNINLDNKINDLRERLRRASAEYYTKGNSSLTDAEYDHLLELLEKYEKIKGTTEDSPTQVVGSNVITGAVRNRIKHEYEMKSLAKSHSLTELSKAINKEPVLSLKLDGLTISATYQNGILTRLETRGDGYEGKNILKYATGLIGLPLQIPYKEKLVVFGEGLIRYNDYNSKENLTTRNLAAGTLDAGDISKMKERKLRFVAWRLIQPTVYTTYVSGLEFLKKLGFVVVPSLEGISEANVTKLVNSAEVLSYPIDGLVATFNDVVYGNSLGSTRKYVKHSMAYKFEDKVHTTKLIKVDWTLGKTGSLCPTAVFEPIDIDGTTVQRASMHNLSIMKGLGVGIGSEIEVFKANMIIPQIRQCVTKGSPIPIPTKCPICGSPLSIERTENADVLMCTSPNCGGQILGKLTAFVSRKGMDIDALSKGTLSKLIAKGYIKEYADIYKLYKHKESLIGLQGFGKQSVENLLSSIEKSRHARLDKFISALSIPLVSEQMSRSLAKYFHNDVEEFKHNVLTADLTKVTDFGEARANAVKNYIYANREMLARLMYQLKFENPTLEQQQRQANKESQGIKAKQNINMNILEGKTFVITGSLNHFTNRDELKEKLEDLGAKVSGSVSSKTTYLVNNDINSNSSKNMKAKELGIKIITENELLSLLR